MKIRAKAIKDFQDFMIKMNSHQTNPEVYDRPIPECIETIVNFKDEDVTDYVIKPSDFSGTGEKDIEITINTNGDGVEILKTKWTQETEDELDVIIEISNKRFREI